MVTGRKFCDPCFFLPTRISIIVLATFQGGIIDYYLVHYNNYNWYAWIAGDVAIIFTFFVAFFISYRELKIVHTTNLLLEQKKAGMKMDAGSFPLIYFAWLVYSVILAIRIALIYKNFAYDIESGVFFGTNMLKFVLAIAGVIFLLLVSAQHEALPGTTARNQISQLTASVPLDIVDSVDILSVFFVKESKDSLEPMFQWAIIVVACINFVLPILPLMMLSGTHFGVHSVPPSRDTLYKLLQIFLINTPLFTLRILMWHKQGEEVSPLIVKNVVMILLVATELYETAGIVKPVENEETELHDSLKDDKKSENLSVLRYSNM